MTSENAMTLELLGEIRDLLSEQSAGALSREAAARHLSVSPATLDRLASAGKVKPVKVSAGRVAYRKIDLENYLASLVEA